MECFSELCKPNEVALLILYLWIVWPRIEKIIFKNARAKNMQQNTLKVTAPHPAYSLDL